MLCRVNNLLLRMSQGGAELHDSDPLVKLFKQSVTVLARGPQRPSSPQIIVDSIIRLRTTVRSRSNCKFIPSNIFTVDQTTLSIRNIISEQVSVNPAMTETSARALGTLEAVQLFALPLHDQLDKKR